MTAEQPIGMPPLAGYGQRFLARFVDNAILLAFDALASSTLLGGDVADARDAPWAKQALVGVIPFLLYFAYEGSMTAARGQTLGKMAVRIRAARLTDGAVPGPAGWTRAAVYALPGLLVALLVGPLFWLLNVLWCTWDRPWHQCLHDKAARTVVVAAV